MSDSDIARRRAVLVALIVLLGKVCPLRADEVYKSVDAEGHAVYSDRGSTSTAQKSVVHVVQPDPIEAARAAKEQAILQVEESQRKQQQSLESRNKAVQDHDKQVRCDSARNYYNSIKDANHLYRVDADGNRAYYTDAEADARREKARQAMTTACGP